MSKIGFLDSRDFIKGFIMFVFGAVLASLLQMLQNGFNGIDYKVILLVATTSGISYLLKNLFSSEDGKFLGKI